MTKKQKKYLRKGGLAIFAFGALFYFLPKLTLFYVICGVIDVMRNDKKDAMLFERYFLGNGIPTWLMSPLNLFADLISLPNHKVWTLDDFPEGHRKELDLTLNEFRTRKDEIIAAIDAEMGDGRRGMYVYQWFGKKYNQSIDVFAQDFKYIQTIAVSVFRGAEQTTYHYGPMRLSIRVLLNLNPVESEDIYIECGKTKQFWHENPLFIFDDTLIHRSVNQNDDRRYCVFIDIARPAHFPGVLNVLLTVVSAITQRIRTIFYKHWDMLGEGAEKTAQAS